MEAKRRSQWLKGIAAFGLGFTLLALEAGGASAGTGTKGTAAPDACDINGARLGVPGTVVTHLLDRGGFDACLDKATNREALECVAATAVRLSQEGGRIDLDGAPIWLVPKTPGPQPWTCTPENPPIGAYCSCEGNDDCVDLILFGPCEGGTMVCHNDDKDCVCFY